MTAESSPYAPSPLGAWMWQRIQPLTNQVVAVLLEEIPFYRLLPREQMQVDIAGIVGLNLRMLARVLTEQREVRPDELDAQRESARRRAEEGVPLDALLGAYHLGAAIAWDEVVGRFGAAPLEEINPTLSIFHDYLREVVRAVAAAYVEEHKVQESHEQDSRRALLAALAEGSDVEVVSQRTGLRPAERYLVLALSIAHHQDELEANRGARVAAQRKARRIQTTFEAASPLPVLTLIDPTAATVLVPVPGSSMTWAEARVLIARVQQAAGANVIAGGMFAGLTDVAQAIQQTTAVVDVARRSGHSEGLFRLEDLLLEFQFSRPSPASAVLAALLDPLDGHPDVEKTLRTYVELSLDRRRTAQTLHLHPNTVDYRIRRARELIGLNPAVAADLQHIQAALICRATNRP